MQKRLRYHSKKAIILFLSLLAIFLVPTIALSAQSVTLAWDANDPTEGPTPDGYRIFKRTEGQATYDYNQPSWTGSNTSGIVENLANDITYYFVVRAYLGTQESADSDEVPFYSPSPVDPTYTLSATSGSNGSISPSGSISVNQGASRTYTITPEAGYHVADVTVDGISNGTITSYVFSNVVNNHSIHADFAINTHTISATSGSNGSISPSGSISVNQGASRTYTITPEAGYHVADVTVDGSSKGAITSYVFSNVVDNHTIGATFAAEETFTITASEGINGTITPSGSVNLSAGGSQAYTISPGSGYLIADVSVDGVSMGAITTYNFANVTKNHSISASFASEMHTVTATAEEGGSISPSGQIQTSDGASQTFTIVADDGYQIIDLEIDGQSVGPQNTHTLENICSDCTVKALFASIGQPPTADAGPDQTVDEAQEVVLSGLNSTDLDDGIAAFQWRQINGSPVELKSADQPEATFTAPDVDGSGVSLEFELAVTDYSGTTSVDKCIVNVSWVNLVPVADAGGEQTVTEGDKVFLDASGSSDPDDGIVSYSWEQTDGPSVTLFDENDQSSLLSFQAPENISADTSLTFELTVTDSGGLQDTDTCLVNITMADTLSLPPLSDAGPNQQANPGDAIFLDGSRSMDTYGQRVSSFQWRQTNGVPVELSDPTAETSSFTAPDLGTNGGDLTFELTVTDSNGMQAKDRCVVSIAPSAPTEDDDALAITVSMDNPGNNYLTVKSSVLEVSGYASGAIQVVWKDSIGTSGMADGTNHWLVKKIKLNRGTNTIRFTAYDAAGNRKSVSQTYYLED